MTHDTPQAVSVAIVEDEVDLAEEVAFHLSRAGMSVTVLHHGQALQRHLATHPCQVVVLDLGLPGEDGLSIATRLSRDNGIRIVMLTARASVVERIQGLDAGADVYLTKPVNMTELVKVVRNVARRLPASQERLRLDPTNHRLDTPWGASVDLTTKEVQFLRHLAQAPEHFLSRSVLEEVLWNLDDASASHRLEVMVSRLRIKLKNAGLQNLVRTERQMGYRLAQKVALINA